jgi:hypothetical protein
MEGREQGELKAFGGGGDRIFTRVELLSVQDSET